MEGERSIESSRHRWEVDIKMNLEEIGRESLPVTSCRGMSNVCRSRRQPSNCVSSAQSIMQQESYGLLPVTSRVWGCRSCTWRLVCFVQ